LKWIRTGSGSAGLGREPLIVDGFHSFIRSKKMFTNNKSIAQMVLPVLPIRIRDPVLSCRVADPHSFHPDPAFYTNPDPYLIRIQGFNDQKFKKNYSWKKKKIIFYQTAIYLSLGLHKERPSYRRSLQLSKEAIQHFKTWTLTNFFLLCGSFFSLLDPDSGSGSTDPIESRSGFATLLSWHRDPDPGWEKILIRDEHPRWFFRELINSVLCQKFLSFLMRIRIRDLFDPRSGMEIFEFGIRYKHLGSATLGVKLATNNITSFPTNVKLVKLLKLLKFLHFTSVSDLI
jgi:hypothetical protein